MRTLDTERLQLRAFSPSDLEELALLHGEPSFWYYPLRRGQTRAETKAFLDRVIAGYELEQHGLGAVVEKKSGKLAGWAGLATPHFLPEVLPAVEVGWRLGEAFRQKGYATEAGAAFVRHGFADLELERIISIFEPRNSPSGHVMDKLGFTLERITTHPGREIRLHVTELTAARWRELSSGGSWPAGASR